MSWISPAEPCPAGPSGSRLLANIHRTLGSNVVSDALSVLAEQPNDLAGFWFAIMPAIRHSIVRSAADEVRRTADGLVRGAARLPDHLSWLAESGCSREESRQIRYVVEAFYNLEPVFAVLASTVVKWLSSGSTDPWIVPEQGPREQTPTFFTGEIDFADSAHDARFSGSLLDGDSRPMHPLMRALAMWPAYLRKMLSDLETATEGGSPREAVVVLRRTLSLLTAHMPIICVATSPAPHRATLQERMGLCLAASVRAIVVASALRRGFVRDEVAARNQRYRAAAP